jgi:hypothetical protein
MGQAENSMSLAIKVKVSMISAVLIAIESTRNCAEQASVQACYIRLPMAYQTLVASPLDAWVESSPRGDSFVAL